MHIIRPIRQDDAEAYAKFAFAAHLGMSNLPKNTESLHKNIQASLAAFASQGTSDRNWFYLFVIEDLATKEIGGICGIYSQIGIDYPYYYYREETLTPKPYKELPIKSPLRILKPVKINQGPSEICSLYLAPPFRKEGLGRLLSLSRFLFIAAFSSRFQESILAEMRGCIDQNNYTPFWEYLGRRFLDVDYAKAQHIRNTDKNFIPYILPEYPIYVDLLPKEAQEMIGKVYENTVPALKMLEKEGFKLKKDYDVFDAGPVVQAQTKAIRTIQATSKGILKDIAKEPLPSNKYIVANGKLDFRACFSFLKHSGEDVWIPAETAEALSLQKGDGIHFATAC